MYETLVYVTYDFFSNETTTFLILESLSGLNSIQVLLTVEQVVVVESFSFSARMRINSQREVPLVSIIELAPWALTLNPLIADWLFARVPLIVRDLDEFVEV
jgi:hypothetical protein